MFDIDLDKAKKGLLLMLAGVILFFYTLGILNKEFIIFLIAICLIIIGFIMFGGVEKAKQLCRKK
ncbi:hypothetical protein ACFLYA_01770 [Candidatus Dependentiae bacterium]